ncbi:excisionase [Bradyrhizobium sp. DASA03007]|uniref:excisionase n=1 Tax=unclassified Bradyrhizobium TaxID=2631580 RepID=UPI003F70BEC7
MKTPEHANDNEIQSGGIQTEIGVVYRDTPLRLEYAARIAFPDGSIGLRGLRREAAKGRLNIELIAGKQYTTLADIDEMRKLCRVPAKGLTSPGGKLVTRTASSTPEPSGSSGMEAPRSPQELLQARLSRSLQSKRSRR